MDEEASAWEVYMEICKIGGTKRFLETVETANLRSPFEGDSLAAVDDNNL